MTKEIKVKTIIVTFREGERAEKPWESLDQEEKSRLAIKFTNQFMSAAGYEAAGHEKETA